mgnify:CR=1 FL=1
MEDEIEGDMDSQTIRVEFSSIVEHDAELLGIFYLKVSSKKFFSKLQSSFIPKLNNRSESLMSLSQTM